MQLHIGALRNVNTRLFSSYGPDGGGDAISDAVIIAPLASFLDLLDTEGNLPKTILYSLDDTKNASLAVLAQCYSGTYAGGGGKARRRSPARCSSARPGGSTTTSMAWSAISCNRPQLASWGAGWACSPIPAPSSPIRGTNISAAYFAG